MSNVVNLMDRLKRKALDEKVSDLAVKVKSLIEESYVGSCLEILFKGWTSQPGVLHIDEKQWPLISIETDLEVLESEKKAVFKFSLSSNLRPVKVEGYGHQSHLCFFSIDVDILEQSVGTTDHPQMDVLDVMRLMDNYANSYPDTSADCYAIALGFVKNLYDNTRVVYMGSRVNEQSCFVIDFLCPEVELTGHLKIELTFDFLPLILDQNAVQFLEETQDESE